MLDTDNFEGEELDVEPYEGEPDWDGHVVDAKGKQDDDAELADIASFVARVASPVNTWRETLEWYKNHQTTEEIGFDPDAMCLKVCRTARKIPARYVSALESQHATPEEHRINKVSNIRRGMVAYFDDPKDSNRFGHIVTVVGRVKGFDKDSLADVLMATNSVKSDELVVVRGDYFQRFWGDEFQFAATSLNGVELDLPNAGTKVERFHDSGPEFDLKILERAGKERPRAQRALNQIMSQVNRLPDSPAFERIRKFKRLARDERVLDMRLLDDIVKDRKTGLLRRVRNEIADIIDALPDE